MKNIYFYQTEIGKISIIDNGRSIVGLYFENAIRPKDVRVNETKLLKQAKQQLDQYFAGKIKNFDLPLEVEGTDFQQKVWKALQDIPYGETCSYGEIANNIGKAKAYRAVGLANNKNPISIIIPCHRVIGKNGKLVGYGGGLETKRYLLDIESKYLLKI